VLKLNADFFGTRLFHAWRGDVPLERVKGIEPSS
jgi:hypothetical protein